MPLTDTAIKALKPKDKAYRVFDGGGLYLEISPAGSKLWRLKYRFEGKEKRLSFGAYPQVALKEARAKGFEAKAVLDSGIDPGAVRAQKAQETIQTFHNVALEWAEKQTGRWTEAHKGTVIYRMGRFVFPHIGGMPVGGISPVDVLKLLRIIESGGKNETAARVLGICSQVFRYAVACGYAASDPCRDLRGALTPPVVVSRAAITEPRKAGALMAAIADYHGSTVVKAALLWSAYTFCRPGEVRQAEWKEIEWEKREWRIPAEKMKMRLPHTVPLCSQCMKILEELREKKFSDVWLFPSVRAGRPLSENGVLSALRNMGYEKNEMSAHGFRAMASTLLNELGFRPDVIEKQLAHGEVDKVRAVYNRAAYMDERIPMMQAWADFLDRLRDEHRAWCRPDPQ